MKSVKKYFPLITIILLYLALVITLGCYKQYFYEDEVLSYTSANSQSGMYIHPDVLKWYDSSLVKNAVTAVPGHTFDFGNTLKNSFSDNHPPLYTLLIHLNSSFFPGRFSKWFGLSVNIAAGMIILILLYFLSLELFDNKFIPALAVTFSYAVSIGFTDTILFIRNYSLLMMFCLLTMLLHVHYLKAGRTPVRFYVMLFLATVSGMMSHYYFLTVAFYIAAFFCLDLLFRKQFRSFSLYAGTMLLSAGAVLMMLPDIISDIFSSQSGSGNFKHRGVAELISRFQQTYVLINKSLFGGVFKFFALAAVIFIIFRLIRGAHFSFRKYAPILLVLWTAVLFYVIGSATLTYIGSRYLSPIYPFIMILIIFVCDKIVSRIFVDPRLGIVIVCFMLALPMYNKISSGLTDNSKLAISQAAAAHSDDYCIFDVGITVEENFFELEKYRGLYFTAAGYDIDDEKIASAPELVVYVPDGMDPDKEFESIRKCNPSLKNSSRLYVAYYSTAYLLSQ